LLRFATENSPHFTLKPKIHTIKQEAQLTSMAFIGALEGYGIFQYFQVEILEIHFPP